MKGGVLGPAADKEKRLNQARMTNDQTLSRKRVRQKQLRENRVKMVSCQNIASQALKVSISSPTLLAG